METELILVGVLSVSVVGHLVSGYFNYKILSMVLRAISPALRHRKEPMPTLQAYPRVEHATDQLEAEFEGFRG